MASYVSPYAERLRALEAESRAVSEAPDAPMFTPEEREARQGSNSRNYKLGVLAQLTGDKSMAGVGESLLKNALAERQRKITDHGEYDPVTGDLKVFPGYTKRIKEERLDKEAAALRALEGKGQDAFNLAREHDLTRRAIAAAGAGNQGSFQAGTDFTPDGRPIVFHNKSGKFAVRDPSGKLVEYNGERISRQDFGKESKLFDTAKATGVRISDAINRVEENKTAFGGGYGGAAVSVLPEALRGIGTNMVFNNEEQQLRATVFEESYQVAKELAGLAQSLNEAVRLEPFTPRPGDPYEVIVNKLQAAQVKHGDLVKKFEAKRAAAGISQPRGPDTATPPPKVEPTLPPKPGGGRVLKFDSQGNSVQ